MHLPKTQKLILTLVHKYTVGILSVEIVQVCVGEARLDVSVRIQHCEVMRAEENYE